MSPRLDVDVVPKTWGKELRVWNDRELNVCGKIMVAEPPGTSRIERHYRKNEVFHVLTGAIRLELFGHGEEPEPEDVLYLRNGDSFLLVNGHWHRFGAVESGTVFAEFSTFHDDGDTDRRPK